MFCPKCGKENPEGAQLCGSCSWVLSNLSTGPLPNAKTSGLATTALVLGILAPLTCGITLIPAVIFGIIALVKISKSHGQLKGSGLAIAGIVVPVAALPIIAILMAILMPALNKVKVLAQKQVCAVNMSTLGKAMITYADGYKEMYPTPSKWCDLLIEKENISPKTFQCKGAHNDGRCNYAMNNNVEKLGTNAPPDMVLLFETDPGWNQYGGPELLTLDNHCGEGCNVVFADGHVEFVPKKELGNLKWAPDTNK